MIVDKDLLASCGRVLASFGKSMYIIFGVVTGVENKP